MSEWQEKVWGRTRVLEEGEAVHRHELQVLKNSFCSVHWHLNRENLFVVTSGVVRVVWCFYDQFHENILGEGNSCTIPSLVVHQFQVLEDGEMFETYKADRGGKVRADDIVRLSPGGRNFLDVDFTRFHDNKPHFYTLSDYPLP